MTERMGLLSVNGGRARFTPRTLRAELRPAARRLAAVAVGFAGGWAVLYGALMPFGLGFVLGFAEDCFAPCAAGAALGVLLHSFGELSLRSICLLCALGAAVAVRWMGAKKLAVTALAGPACNFLLALLFLFLYGLLYYPLYVHGGAVAETVLQLVYTTAYLSLALAVFNLIPIPPLDGSKVLFSFIPDESYFKLMRYERYGMILLLVLVSTKILGGPLSTATSWLFDKLLVFAEFGFRLVTHFV